MYSARRRAGKGQRLQIKRAGSMDASTQKLLCVSPRRSAGCCSGEQCRWAVQRHCFVEFPDNPSGATLHYRCMFVTVWLTRQNGLKKWNVLAPHLSYMKAPSLQVN